MESQTAGITLQWPCLKLLSVMVNSLQTIAQIVQSTNVNVLVSLSSEPFSVQPCLLDVHEGDMVADEDSVGCRTQLDNERCPVKSLITGHIDVSIGVSVSKPNRDTLRPECDVQAVAQGVGIEAIHGL